jgi:hypothetical protein
MTARSIGDEEFAHKMIAARVSYKRRFVQKSKWPSSAHLIFAGEIP